MINLNVHHLCSTSVSVFEAQLLCKDKENFNKWKEDGNHQGMQVKDE